MLSSCKIVHFAAKPITQVKNTWSQRHYLAKKHTRSYLAKKTVPIAKSENIKDFSHRIFCQEQKKFSVIPQYHRQQLISLGVAFSLILGIFFTGFKLQQWSSVKNSHLITGTAPPQESLFSLPVQWKLAWSSSSSLSTVGTNGVIITSDQHTVIGHNSATGKSLWKYSRKALLCQVLIHQDMVITVYRDARGCGDIVKLDPTTGFRSATRSEFSDSQTLLLPFNDYLLYLTSQFAQIWSPELIKLVEYGSIIAPSQPDGQPRHGCTLLHGFIGDTATSLIEHCPQEEFARLTVINNTAVADHDHDPDEIISRALPILEDGKKTVIVNSSKEKTLVAVSQSQKHTVIIVSIDNTHDGTHTRVLRTFSNPDNQAIVSQHSFEQTSIWISGTSYLLNSESERIIATIPKTLGPGIFLGFYWYFPVPNGIIAISPSSGKQKRFYAIPDLPANTPFQLSSDNRNLIITGNGKTRIYAPVLDHSEPVPHYVDS